MPEARGTFDHLRVAGLGGLYNGAAWDLLPGQSATVGASSLATYPATRTRVYRRLAGKGPATSFLSPLDPEHIRLLYLGEGRLIIENLSDARVLVGGDDVRDRTDLLVARTTWEIRFGYGERLVVSVPGSDEDAVIRAPRVNGADRARETFAALLRPPGSPRWEDREIFLAEEKPPATVGEARKPDSVPPADPVSGPEKKDGKNKKARRGFRVSPATALSALLHIVIVLGLFSQIRANLGRPRGPLVAEVAVEKVPAAEVTEPPPEAPAPDARPTEAAENLAPSTMVEEERPAGPLAEEAPAGHGDLPAAGVEGAAMAGFAGLGPGGLGGPPGGGGGGRSGEGRSTADPDGAIALGLEWLARHQLADGSWGAITSMKDEWPSMGRGKREYRIAMTGLALLAFVQAGHTHSRGEHADTVRAAARYLVGEEQKTGSFSRKGTPAKDREMYGNGIATFALAELYRESGFPILKTLLRREVRFLMECQAPYAGWRYGRADRTSDTSVTGWQVLALDAAERAGIRVNPVAFYGALSFIEDMTEPGTFRVGYNQRGRGSLAMTATGVLVRLLRKARVTGPAVSGGRELMAANLPVWPPVGKAPPPGNPPDLYYWYFGSLAAERIGNKFRQEWNRSLRPVLIERQERMGSLKGSWPSPGRWCGIGGRVMSTALAVLCLEASYRR